MGMTGFDFGQAPETKEIREQTTPNNPDDVATKAEVFYLKRLMIQNTVSIDAKLNKLFEMINNLGSSPSQITNPEVIRKMFMQQLQNALNDINFLKLKLLELENKTKK